MFLKFFLPLVLVLFACAPLRPIAPTEETPSPAPEQKKEEPPPTPEPTEPDTIKRQIIEKNIDVGVGFEKRFAVIECPEKKWEFKAGKNSRTEIETKGNCTYAGKTYRGTWIVLSADTGITIINHLDTEDY